MDKERFNQGNSDQGQSADEQSFDTTPPGTLIDGGVQKAIGALDAVMGPQGGGGPLGERGTTTGAQGPDAIGSIGGGALGGSGAGDGPMGGGGTTGFGSGGSTTSLDSGLGTNPSGTENTLGGANDPTTEQP